MECYHCREEITDSNFHVDHIMHWECYEDYLDKLKERKDNKLKRGSCNRCYLDTMINKAGICLPCHKSLGKEDIINKPNHYHDGVQPIEAIETNFEELETRGFLKGNVLKYVMRSNKKGKELEDLKKAQWNLNKLIERLEDNKINPLSKERNR